MKNLILVRHAKSSWDDPKLDDFHRPLNKRGMRDAPFMGKLVAERGDPPEIILTSPATRAAATARHIAGALGLPPARVVEHRQIYAAGPDTLMDVILELDDAVRNAMLVGHNPGMTQLAGRLSTRPVDHMPTCAVVALSFDTDEWKKVILGGGTLKYFETPKKHFPKKPGD